jgi:hypothetical protein
LIYIAILILMDFGIASAKLRDKHKKKHGGFSEIGGG